MPVKKGAKNAKEERLRRPKQAALVTFHKGAKAQRDVEKEGSQLESRSCHQSRITNHFQVFLCARPLLIDEHEIRNHRVLGVGIHIGVVQHPDLLAVS
jgi:hypothetical protein